MRVALLGFGLIGGSIARAIHATPGTSPWSIAAWSPSGVGPAKAVDDGVIARAAGDPVEAMDGADLVILAAPPLDCLDLLDALAGPLSGALPPDAALTDVAGAKRAVMARAASLGLRFVGGHPMAGRERTGYAASSADLFHGRPWVIVQGPDARPRDVIAVERLAHAVGADPLHMTAAAHDAAVAAISHLPLVVAAALVEAIAGTDDGAWPEWPAESRLAASGWRDMTRLARGDVAMGTGMLATNADAIAAHLHALQATLDAWLADLEHAGGPDATTLAARLAAAKARLEGPPE